MLCSFQSLFEIYYCVNGWKRINMNSWCQKNEVKLNFPWEFEDSLFCIRWGKLAQNSDLTKKHRQSIPTLSMSFFHKHKFIFEILSDSTCFVKFFDMFQKYFRFQKYKRFKIGYLQTASHSLLDFSHA